jgi:nicotinate-nucleotide adenylyltransferase
MARSAPYDSSRHKTYVIARDEAPKQSRSSKQYACFWIAAAAKSRRAMTRVAQADLRPPPALAGMRIGLLGGSFNPPHAAHRLISLTALKRLGLDRVWWMVTPGNPLKEHGGLLPLGHRIQLSRQVARHPRIEITAFEAGIGTAYTERSLSFLRRRFPGVHFVWLMGADNLASFHRWKEWETIFHLMPIAAEDRPAWRYKALSSPAASRFSRFRIPESQAAALPSLDPPAWCYLSGPLSKLSSTALRALQPGGRPVAEDG